MELDVETDKERKTERERQLLCYEGIESLSCPFYELEKGFLDDLLFASGDAVGFDRYLYLFKFII